MKVFLASVGMLLAGSSTNGLERLLLEGPELHRSLTTHVLDGSPVRHVSADVVRENPQLSSDADFVKAIARSGSQGRLDGDGMTAALYARYDSEADLGFYGLQAATEADADQREAALRQIWSHNISIDRAKIHRGGLTLVVVWTDGLSPDVWTAVNDRVAHRLATP